MKLVISAALAAAVLASTAFADDAMRRATPSKHQMMKECMEKQKTADVNMSKSQMERLCKGEMKRLRTPADQPPPASDAPRSP